MRYRARPAIGLVVSALMLSLAACAIGPIADAPPNRAGSGSSPTPGLSSATDRQIADAQDALRHDPVNAVAMVALAAAYLQKVRETGDPTYYGKADSLLQSALHRDPQSFDATVLSGQLALARHNFTSGLAWGQAAHQLRPQNSTPYGLLVDAEVELGRYDAAGADVQTMVNLHPDLGSYSRVSYLRELHGDVDGAIAAMHDAVIAGGPYPENTAYVQVLLGNLYFNKGDLAAAEAQYREVLGPYPTYVHGLAALAAVDAAKGKYPEAEKLYVQAVNVYPLPQYVIAEGDVYRVAGDAKRAADAYDLAAAEQQLYRANGIDLDQELALFDADHQRDLAGALAAAKRAIRDRPSVVSADVLGWTLYQTGDYGDALAEANQALRLGTRDALFFFHRGMAEMELGMTAPARTDLEAALSINPHFSLLHVPEAKAALQRLGAS